MEKTTEVQKIRWSIAKAMSCIYEALSKSMNGYHKSAASKKPINKVNYDTIHKGIQGTGNIIV